MVDTRFLNGQMEVVLHLTTGRALCGEHVPAVEVGMPAGAREPPPAAASESISPLATIVS
jgi:hypothetical protein